jgi:hypothetical protein
LKVLLKGDGAMTDEAVKLGFAGEDGGFVSFEEVAKDLPVKYDVVDENGLPPLSERAVIHEESKFYDLFQVIHVSEASSSNGLEEGWYWVTYFSDPSTGCGHIGPFTTEEDASNDAASKALPINDTRRADRKIGCLGGGFMLHNIIGAVPR